MKKVQQRRNQSISAQQAVDAQGVDLHARIAAAAYFRAQERGFEPGQEIDDWLAAEAEIKGKLDDSQEA